MSANPLNSTPITPFPDPPSHSAEEPGQVTGQPVDSPSPPNIAKPSTSSADDLSLLLAQSSPDPYLDEGVGPTDRADPGKTIADIAETEQVSSLDAHSPETQLNITFSPSPDAQPVAHQHVTTATPATRQTQDNAAAPRTSWPLLLVSSYASAVTLALGFILWTGRGLTRPDFSTPSEPVPAGNGPSPSRGATQTGGAPLPLPVANLTSLGGPVRIGELEVIPHSITRRPVNLLRLQGAAEGEHESPPALVLLVEVTNRSRTSTFAPLDLAIVREPLSSLDQSFIELSRRRRIAMFRLAIESEWSIQDQVFPALKPGESVETILVSEPVAMSDLAGTMTWHVKLRTAPYRTDVLGVRFTADQVANESE